MVEEVNNVLGVDNMPLPVYVTSRPVWLKKRRWVQICRDILRREGRGDVKIFIEPGPFFYWPESFGFFILRIIGLRERSCILGSCCTARTATGNAVTYIHLRSAGSRDEMMDTIVHEVAHALVSEKAHHGPLWKEKYEYLRQKYCPDASVFSGTRDGRTTTVLPD